jgi:hypothetical protein
LIAIFEATEATSEFLNGTVSQEIKIATSGKTKNILFNKLLLNSY